MDQLNRYLVAPYGADKINLALDTAIQKNPQGQITLDWQAVHQVNHQTMDQLVEHIGAILATPQQSRPAFTFLNTNDAVTQAARISTNRRRVAITIHKEQRRPTPLEQAQWWRRGSSPFHGRHP